MLRLLNILWNSFKMSVGELKNNKLRSALSLTGVAFGIFCIISVLATVNSLEYKIQSDIAALGTNTIYIDKWEYGAGDNGDYPWWRFVNRPMPKYDDVKYIKERTSLAENVAFFTSRGTTLEYENSELQNVAVFGVSNEYNRIQTVDMGYGRYFTEAEFQRGNPVAIIGYNNAEELFGTADRAIGKTISFDGHRAVVVGVIQKQGQSFGPGFDYDHALILTYYFYAGIYNVLDFNSDPFIMVKGRPGIPSGALSDELKGVMRQVRRLSPKEEDNFALNDVNFMTEAVSGFFGTVNVGGWAIAGLSLIVGAFGVANIMFVTVRERTSQIGLKKAIGAKSRTILLEFLLESAFLCIIGGFIGLLMVWGLAAILSAVLPFAIVISGKIISLAFSICVILGILSGIIPASIAARMNPVEAIRSK
ncbi:MAG TPA: ABC transporter permease [Parafilimonas sp.]|nr:ABC transporter permease [Parafilimonas sp.]